jgi:uncharacterized protein YggT (Ycf19 family)
MPNNISPDEPTEIMPPIQQLKPVSQTPAPPPQGARPSTVVAASQSTSAGDEDTQSREDALTIKFAIGKLNDYIQWFVMVLESILLIRFVLRIFGADPTNPFASFILALTQILLVPFGGLLPNPGFRPPIQAFEFTTLFAALIYFLIFFAFKRFLHILISNPSEQGE